MNARARGGELPFTPRITADSEGHWAAASREQFAFQRCGSCGRLRWPAGPVCPLCWSDLWSWQPVPSAGVLQTWVTYRREYFPEFPVPYAVGQAEFGSEVRYQALLDLPLDDLRPGLRVQVEYRSAPGQLTDGSPVRLPVFVGGEA